MIYLDLFLVFFKIGLFGFGGGYGMVSLIRMDVVEKYQWMSAGEFADLLAVSQMTPGPISINTATYVGFTQASVLGSIIATFALCLPSIIMMAIVLKLFFKHKDSPYVTNVMKYITLVVAGLIIGAALSMYDQETFSSIISFVIFLGTLAATYFWKINPILLIVISGFIGWLWGLWMPTV
ncbi:MAG: chromate transporter [Bacteroidales bacterium]|nr:chromate transporter [Bacteroidales bacterium]